MGNFLRLSNGALRSFAEASSTAIYDQTYIASGAVTAGTAITLPSAQTYTGAELTVHLNGQEIESVVDYNYVGSGSGKTQITLTFDLVLNDRVRFRIERGP